MDNSGQERDLLDEVYGELLKRLCDEGSIAAERLSVPTIAKELGVSRTPVTMALVRLEKEGLVRRNKEGGWVTMQLGLDDIFELFDLWEVLGPLASSEAAKRITEEGAARLMRAVKEMEEAASADNLLEWRMADRRFHACLFDIMGNSRLQALQLRIDRQLSRVTLSDVAIHGRMVESSREHRAIAEAAVSGDSELARSRTEAHVSSLKASLVDTMKNIVGPLLGQQLQDRVVGPA